MYPVSLSLSLFRSPSVCVFLSGSLRALEGAFVVSFCRSSTLLLLLEGQQETDPLLFRTCACYISV